MYVERSIRKRFEKLRKSYSIIALTGARQSGKTTFLKEQGKNTNAKYLLFDDPDIKELFEEDIKKFEQQYMGNNLNIFDEVHNCKKAGSKLKYLADSGHKIWITSSSKTILRKHILSYLVGRVSTMKLYPFSFEEFIEAKKKKAMTKNMEKRLVWEHMTYGGYPKTVLENDTEMKEIILNDLNETMLLKDVAKTFSIHDISSLEKTGRFLSNNVGSMLSYDSAANSLGISFPTLKKYLDALEKSYLIFLIPPYSKNRNKEISKQPKVYFVDTGMKNAISKNFGAKADGRLFENYVLSELIKAGFSPKYWRTKAGAEVDFIIENKGEIIPIECKLKAESVGKSLFSFIDSYKPSRAFIVNYESITKEKNVNGCKVSICGIRELIDLIHNSDLQQ